MSNHPMKKRTKLTVALIGLLALGAMLLGIYGSLQRAQTLPMDYSQFSATVLNEPRPLPLFDLTDGQGNTVSNTVFDSQWSLVFFGFTSCPHICPTAMHNLATVYDLASNNGSEVLPQVMLFTVDPRRDDAKKMQSYVTAFNPDFIGITGEKSELDQVAKFMGVVSMTVPNDNNTADHYDISHSDAIMLINPNGELTAFFTTPHDPAIIAEEFQLLAGNIIN